MSGKILLQASHIYPCIHLLIPRDTNIDLWGTIVNSHGQRFGNSLELQCNSLSMLVKVYAKIWAFIVMCVLCFGQSTTSNS